MRWQNTCLVADLTTLKMSHVAAMQTMASHDSAADYDHMTHDWIPVADTGLT